MDSTPAEVALVLATDPYGRVLMGVRNDNGRWTLPGGHLNPGEQAKACAARELLEETGLPPKSLTYLGTHAPAGPGYPTIHRFSALVVGDPHGRDDPDAECSTWNFVDVRGGLPANIWDNLHGPQGDTNLVRQVFELQKSDQVWVGGDHPFVLDQEDLAKAESEAGRLLRHPDPMERLLALRLDSCSPADVARAVLDPHPQVWRAALDHPQGGHARDVLAHQTRDAAGLPIWDRHDALLQHGALRPEHVGAMYRATRDAADLPEFDRALRLGALGSHPLLPATEAPRLVKHWGHQTLAEGSGLKDVTDHARETVSPHLQNLADAYTRYIDTARPVQPSNALAGLKNTGDASPKVVYRIPVEGYADLQRIMVKPYHENNSTDDWDSSPLSGWGEFTSQAVFQAAGLGAYHQSSFPVAHGHHDYRVPAVAIHIQDAVAATGRGRGTWTPEGLQTLRRAGLLDYVLGNSDRHGENLLIRNGMPFFIDHAEVGRFAVDPDSSHPSRFYNTWSAIGHFTSLPDAADFAWWATVAPAVDQVLKERLELVTDPQVREALAQGFTARMEKLARGVLPSFTP